MFYSQAWGSSNISCSAGSTVAAEVKTGSGWTWSLKSVTKDSLKKER